MVISNQLLPGTVIVLKKKPYRVESCVKVTVSQGKAFIKTKLYNLTTGAISEKNFKLKQQIEEAILEEKEFEFLYAEKKGYLFLDVVSLESVFVSSEIVGDKINYLKEGVQVKAIGYNNTIFTVELPLFLELLVVSTEDVKEDFLVTDTLKKVILETGAVIEAPIFVENGDLIKVDTRTHEYIQRI